MHYTDGINPSVKNEEVWPTVSIIAFGQKFRFFTESIDPSAYDFFLLMTVDLIGFFPVNGF
jgi:hypothetical protein